MTQLRVHVFLNGEYRPGWQDHALISGEQEYLVAVDGGLHHLLQAGHVPNLLIGDLDSALPEEIQQAVAGGARILKFPTEKDQTDFELALEEISKLNPDLVCVYAALGGRMDQTLGNLFLVGAPRYDRMRIALIHGPETYRFIHNSAKILGRNGDAVSLIPWGEPCQGVTTRNLLYPLFSETLYPDRSRGISNRMTAPEAEVSMTQGRLLCIHTSKSI